MVPRDPVLLLSVVAVCLSFGSPSQAQQLFSDSLERPQDLHNCGTNQDCIAEYIASCQPAEIQVDIEGELGSLPLTVSNQIEVWGQTPAGCLVHEESLQIQITDLPDQYSEQSGLNEAELTRRIQSQIPLMRSWCQCELETLDLCAELALGRTTGVTFGTAESPVELAPIPFDPETTPSFSEALIDDRLIQTCEIYLKSVSSQSQSPINLFEQTLEDLISHLELDPRISEVQSSPLDAVIFELRRQISDSARITAVIGDVDLSFLVFQVKLGRNPVSVLGGGLPWYWGMSIEPDDCITLNQFLFCLDPESDPEAASSEIKQFFTEVTRRGIVYDWDCGEYPSSLEALWGTTCPNGKTINQAWLDRESAPSEIQVSIEVEEDGRLVFTLTGQGENKGLICISDGRQNECRWDEERLEQIKQGTEIVFSVFQDF